MKDKLEELKEIITSRPRLSAAIFVAVATLASIAEWLAASWLFIYMDPSASNLGIIVSGLIGNAHLAVALMLVAGIGAVQYWAWAKAYTWILAQRDSSE